jgi:uncharacterized protein (DUF1684 family)
MGVNIKGLSIRSVVGLVLFGLLWNSCTLGNNQKDKKYFAEIEHWQQLRIDSLKGKTGYLNLAGLFWLEEGESTIGADSSNTFIFPAKAAPFLGKLVVKNDSVWFMQSISELVAIKDNLKEDTVLVYTATGLNRSMRFKDLSWFIIDRGKDLGIRLKDYNHPLLSSFNHIENYPIDPDWRVEATWETYPTPKIVNIKNQVGMDLEMPAPGAFHFTIAGEEYILEPTGNQDDETYFTMIYDETSGKTTYGSGRYIDVPRPDINGVAYIDFNKAYNPPCAFTEFATCTFPHATNRLPFKIEAGEKYSGSH